MDCGKVVILTDRLITLLCKSDNLIQIQLVNALSPLSFPDKRSVVGLHTLHLAPFRSLRV